MRLARISTAALVMAVLWAAFGSAEVNARDRWILTKWELSGASSIRLEDLEGVLGPAPGDSIGLDELAVAAASFESTLRDAGYWDAVVTGTFEREGAALLSSDSTAARLEVELGELVEVGEVRVRGHRVLSAEEILALMELRPGQAFQRGVLAEDAKRVLRAYSERGFPRARVYPSQFDVDSSGRLSFVMRIGEGPETTLESVRIFGAPGTADPVVARIAGLRRGDPWDVRRVERASGRLRRSGIFTSVGEPRVVKGSRHDRVGVEISVEEGPSNTIFGVLGYNPRPEGGGELVGRVDLDLRNIAGTARRASLRFEKQVGDVQDVAFRFREPWVLGSSFSLEGGAAQARRDTLYSRTDLDVALSVPLSDDSEMRAAFERRRSSFDALGETIVEVSTGGSLGISLDRRDRRVNPSRGWRADLSVGVRQTESGERRTRVRGTAQQLLSVARNWTLSEEVGFFGVESTAGVVPLYEQLYVGGTNTIRGYREEQFHGEKVWWARTELRYRLALRSRGYAFFDAGGFSFSPGETSGTGTSSDVLFGGGVGVALETRGSGLVRFELALGRGDGFSDAKVHAGVEQEF